MADQNKTLAVTMDFEAIVRAVHAARPDMSDNAVRAIGSRAMRACHDIAALLTAHANEAEVTGQQNLLAETMGCFIALRVEAAIIERSASPEWMEMCRAFIDASEAETIVRPAAKQAPS